MKFSATLDKPAKAITAFIILLFIGIGSYSLKALIFNAPILTEILLHLSIILFLDIVLASVWIYSPQYYSVENNTVIIHRKVGSIAIPFSEIKHSTTLTDVDMKGTIRTMGVGGLFGYFGKFSVPSIGNSSLYATQMSNYVLLKLKNDKIIIITPDDLSLVGQIR